MGELDARKEKISFLTKLFFVVIGAIVLLISELASMFHEDNVGVLFWLGVFSVLFLLVGCAVIFNKIQANIEEIRKL